MKTLKSIHFLALAALSITLLLSCNKSSVTPVTTIPGQLASPEPFTAVFAKTAFTLNTNPSATLVSDSVAAYQVTKPDGISTGQYVGSTQFFYWLEKPTSATTGWLIAPVKSLKLAQRNNGNPSIIDRRFEVLYATPFCTPSELSFAAQLVQPLGSTATTPLTVEVDQFGSYFDGITGKNVDYISTKKTITLSPENFAWNASSSQLDALTANSAAVHLTDYISVSGVTFTGAGAAIVGDYFYPNKVTGSTYTITATKLYDNGTFQITKQITLH